MNSLIERLRDELQKPLPGIDAHRLMVPKETGNVRFDPTKMQQARLSSVLIMFYERHGELYLPLTQRHDYGGTHSGQVSFPGGKWEPGDLNLIVTATREAEEEIGIAQNMVQVLGQLTDLFIPPSNFKVTPVVSYTTIEPEFKLDSYEVKELIEVPLTRLLDKDVVKTTHIPIRGGLRLNAPYFDLNNKIVWGATAMMLSELVAILKRVY